MAKVLILGGTAEAGELAARLAGDDRLATVTSLAGLTRMPAAIAGQARRGGFGGPDGLAANLMDENYDVLVDATHPFAQTIAANAVEAAEIAGVPLIKLVRPPFERLPGDWFIDVPDMQTAVENLPENARVFLAAGRREIRLFAERSDIWCLVRMIEPPAPGETLPRGEVILGHSARAPEAEEALLKKHDIGWIVSKDSGGKASAKIEAARRLGLPVILISRPEHSAEHIVADVDDVIEWLEDVLFA
jgi:precorrin-6A/cobalt-precorrin-6A reductase